MADHERRRREGRVVERRGRKAPRRPVLFRWLLGRMGVDVRRHESSAAYLLFLYCFLLGTFQFTSKTLRQSSFIDTWGFESLPFVYLLLAICAYPVLRYYSRFTDRVARHRLAIASNLLIALSLLLFWWLYGYEWRWVRFAFYLWISIATVMGVSQFYSFANQIFDPRQARRLFGFIGAGGLLGGVAGGQVARLTAGVADTRATFFASVAMLLLICLTIPFIERASPNPVERRRRHQNDSENDRATNVWETIRQSRLLQLIAVVMLLTTMVAQIVDLQFNWIVERQTVGLDERTRTFGNLYSLMGLSAFLFQLLFTSRIHRHLGIGVAMRVLPLATMFGTALLLLASAMFSGVLGRVVAGLKIGENALRYSLDQSTRELLFLPVPAGARRRAKAYIDVLVQRFGRGAGALLLLTVTFGLLDPPQTGWITVALCAVWLGVTVVARRLYIGELRAGLVTRQTDTAAPIDPSDPLTLEALFQSLGSADPREVLNSLELLVKHRRAHLVPPLLLHHDDGEVRRRTLRALVQADRRDAVSMIERLIGDGDPDVRAEAIRAVAVLAGKGAPDLMLQRLRDPDLRIRGAAIHSLIGHKDEGLAHRAEAALLGLLSDAEPQARLEAAKVIGEIREPRYQEHLIKLLFDADERVVRHAVLAIRRRVERDGPNPLYIPILISLLRKRRVKHDVREALVAYGEAVVSALVHFMNDPNEQIWVRRAMPKTIARIESEAARQALLDGLDATDPFLRRKVIEALGDLPAPPTKHRSTIEGHIVTEARLYLENLALLYAVSARRTFVLKGPLLVWRRDPAPSLLQELLADRMRDHLRNLFGLLSLLHPPRDIWAAHERLLGESSALRGHALEYLDHVVEGAAHRPVFLVIDDLPLAERLRQMKRVLGIDVPTRVEALRRLITEEPPGGVVEAQGPWLAAAALYTVWADRITALYPEVRKAQDADDELIPETASWVMSRLQRATA